MPAHHQARVGPSASVLLVLVAACTPPISTTPCGSGGGCPAGYVCDPAHNYCAPVVIPVRDASAVDGPRQEASVLDAEVTDLAAADTVILDLRGRDVVATDRSTRDREPPDREGTETARHDNQSIDMAVTTTDGAPFVDGPILADVRTVIDGPWAGVDSAVFVEGGSPVDSSAPSDRGAFSDSGQGPDSSSGFDHAFGYESGGSFDVYLVHDSASWSESGPGTDIASPWTDASSGWDLGTARDSASSGVDASSICPNDNDTNCLGLCVDLATDEDNCGFCNTSCQAGEVCGEVIAGQCSCDQGACPFTGGGGGPSCSGLTTRCVCEDNENKPCPVGYLCVSPKGCCQSIDSNTIACLPTAGSGCSASDGSTLCWVGNSVLCCSPGQDCIWQGGMPACKNKG
ncbi:MAG: hypothetical protein ABIJ09_14955 [Pseudomonadota bacterium]